MYNFSVCRQKAHQWNFVIYETTHKNKLNDYGKFVVYKLYG